MSSGGRIEQVHLMSSEDVHALCVRELGLDADAVNLEAPEALAALVRRAASFVAPCSARALRGLVLRALDGLVGSTRDERDELRASVDEVIEALLGYGDLLELPVDDVVDGVAARTLYLAPPTYVRIDEVLFLLGGALDGVEAVPADLRGLVECRSHTRRLRLEVAADAAKRLKAIGWVELRHDLWLSAPVRESAGQMLERANAALTAKPTTGEVPGLSVLDPQAPTWFYRGRWTEPSRRTGRFIARREQRYGADLWSYVALVNGAVTQLVDLPLHPQPGVRPCDAAWHLQMAIDSLAGHPQLYRRRQNAPSGAVLIDFFSPVPLWARRRWDVLGEEVPPIKSLFSYSFPADVFSNVEQTLHSELWLAERFSS